MYIVCSGLSRWFDLWTMNTVHNIFLKKSYFVCVLLESDVATDASDHFSVSSSISLLTLNTEQMKRLALKSFNPIQALDSAPLLLPPYLKLFEVVWFHVRFIFIMQNMFWAFSCWGKHVLKALKFEVKINKNMHILILRVCFKTVLGFGAVWQKQKGIWK